MGMRDFFLHKITGGMDDAANHPSQGQRPLLRIWRLVRLLLRMRLHRRCMYVVRRRLRRGLLVLLPRCGDFPLLKMRCEWWAKKVEGMQREAACDCWVTVFT
jgi:hypothetical protein